MTNPKPANKRRYRGMDGGERESARRERLLAAGLELFGTAGYNASTVEDVCRQAGMAKKFFYESFSDREALLLAIYDAEIDRAQLAVLRALGDAAPTAEEQAAAGFSAFLRTVGADPRVTRIVFCEIIRAASPATEERYQRAKREFADFIADVLTRLEGVPPTKVLRMGTTQIIGAINELMTDQVLGHLDATLDEIIDLTLTLAGLTYRWYMQELPQNPPT
ncbi:TetR/AcrR family transcriptional regulator [Actinomadura rupiterrae]|uniref:TetR/AcrR family transcriptional regulator n=1 Tax=Actinomadura rupiterrae TaxID=559627 RepID=UPI0020A5B0AB|nr:TetR/AcrR family transcriptional regulator [Actinomadura rupiterrae]MCP2342176.1 AcrR family transcriptional regulator [Actinomadura rupiterrae]